MEACLPCKLLYKTGTWQDACKAWENHKLLAQHKRREESKPEWLVRGWYKQEQPEEQDQPTPRVPGCAAPRGMQPVLRDSCQKTTTWELGEGPSAEYLSVQGMVSGGTEGKTEESHRLEETTETWYLNITCKAGPTDQTRTGGNEHNQVIWTMGKTGIWSVV